MCCLGYGNASYDKWHQFTSLLCRFCVICWCSWIVSIDLYSSRIIVLKAKESSTGFIQPEKLLPFSTIYWYILAINFCDTQINPQKLAKKKIHSNFVSSERDSSSLFTSYFTKYRNISKIQKPSTFPRAAKTNLKHDDTIKTNNSINTNHYFLLWVCVYHKYVIGH